jgi:NAD(P)-dependent dehydrogenase (short-subunit alcohol dehydrogenase family)
MKKREFLAFYEFLWYNGDIIYETEPYMRTQSWINRNCRSLSGKTVAITGSTGGLGRALCRHLAALGANLILLDRNQIRSKEHQKELLADFPAISVKRIATEQEDMGSVRAVCEQLKREPLDCLILNAGAYSIPRHICETGLDNVFQINFVSPYFMARELLPHLRERGGRVVAVGSIAHNYSKTDPADRDFRTRKKASLVYGNAKRHLMYSLTELFAKEDRASLAIAHPGITFTNITAHYPKLIFTLIKHPMKVIFMSPRRASLSILAGVFEPCVGLEWIGPRTFDVWGLPKKKRLRTATDKEIQEIHEYATELYTILSRGDETSAQ